MLIGACCHGTVLVDEGGVVNVDGKPHVTAGKSCLAHLGAIGTLLGVVLQRLVSERCRNLGVVIELSVHSYHHVHALLEWQVGRNIHSDARTFILYILVAHAVDAHGNGEGCKSGLGVGDHQALAGLGGVFALHASGFHYFVGANQWSSQQGNTGWHASGTPCLVDKENVAKAAILGLARELEDIPKLLVCSIGAQCARWDVSDRRYAHGHSVDGWQLAVVQALLYSGNREIVGIENICLEHVKQVENCLARDLSFILLSHHHSDGDISLASVLFILCQQRVVYSVIVAVQLVTILGCGEECAHVARVLDGVEPHHRRSHIGIVRLWIGELVNCVGVELTVEVNL